MNANQLTLLLIAGVLGASTRDAAAYIDPGSSSYVFQLLIAGLTAIVFFFSSIKRKIAQYGRMLFRRGEGGGPSAESVRLSEIEAPASRDI
jgi:hypothetical protein